MKEQFDHYNYNFCDECWIWNGCLLGEFHSKKGVRVLCLKCYVKLNK